MTIVEGDKENYSRGHGESNEVLPQGRKSLNLTLNTAWENGIYSQDGKIPEITSGAWGFWLNQPNRILAEGKTGDQTSSPRDRGE